MEVTSKGFKKPADNEFYDIDIFNDNAQLTNDLFEGVDSAIGQIGYFEMLSKDQVTFQAIPTNTVTKIIWHSRVSSGQDRQMVSFDGLGNITFAKKGKYYLVATIALTPPIPANGIFSAYLGGIQTGQSIVTNASNGVSVQISRYIEFTEDGSTYNVSAMQTTGQTMNISQFAYLQIQKVG